MISTLDLGFRDLPRAAGAFLLKCTQGHVLIECGPAACWKNLVDELHRHDSSPRSAPRAPCHDLCHAQRFVASAEV